MRNVHWVSRSNDKKIGKVLASYSSKSTCPDSCNLKTGGCYAWGLYYLNVLSSKIEDGRLKKKDLISAMTDRHLEARIVRHRVAGDVVGDVDETLKECEFVSKNGLTNIGYTHTWREKESQPLSEFFRASCSNLSEVLEARSKGWAATIIVPKGTKKVIQLPNGEKAYMCPARYGEKDKKDITCNTCTLCRVDSKTSNKTVMFEAHGNASTIKKIGGKIGSVI
jgi:hypothetical protein